MKIERVEALTLSAKMKPLRIATTTFTECRALIVRVTTDDGLTGIGESLVRSAARATKYLVEEMLAPLILGKDPTDTAGLWWDMFSAVAIIWPGGGFGKKPVEFARQYGYRLGFTVNPRGPVMYNWVPLAHPADPARPAFMPEGYVNDPRMVLPRYWPYQVQANLDLVRKIGKEAAAYHDQNKAAELEYYDILCAPAMRPIP